MDAYFLNSMKQLVVKNFVERLLEIQVNNIKGFRNDIDCKELVIKR